MAYYRISYQFNVTANAGTSAKRHFVAGAECPNPLAARQKGLSLYRELALNTGTPIEKQPSDTDFVAEESDNRGSGLLEISSLEVRPQVFCMTLTGPLESATALQLDKEAYHIQETGCHSLIIELGHVHPLGSAGLGVLLTLNDRLEISLVQVPIRAKKMMAILGLEASLSIHESFTKALEKI